MLISDVQAFADRPIVDGTGLSGLFEWEVTFLPSGAVSAEVPNLFTAFREELGLKFDAETAPFEVLVIDSVKLPTPN